LGGRGAGSDRGFDRGERYPGSRARSFDGDRSAARGTEYGERAGDRGQRYDRSNREPSRHQGNDRSERGGRGLGEGLADPFGLSGSGSAHEERPRRPQWDVGNSHRPGRYEREYGERPQRERPSGSRIRAEDDGHAWPEIPEWVDTHDLGGEVLADLRGLSKQGSEFVAGHLAAAGELAETDPKAAWEHARAARSQGGRIAVVRETVGLVAYRAGKWAEAIAELRAARRMAGGPGLLAVMADAERALGRPERAIELARSPEAAGLDPAAAAELGIVVAGARADLGQHDAALASLRSAVGDVDPQAPHAFRLYYAYAALLQDTGRRDEAQEWFVRAADADVDDDSDAAERAQALAGDDLPDAVRGDAHGDQTSDTAAETPADDAVPGQSDSPGETDSPDAAEKREGVEAPENTDAQSVSGESERGAGSDDAAEPDAPGELGPSDKPDTGAGDTIGSQPDTSS